MQSNFCKTKTAFTIVELLVVIAILAVLFALLLPTMSRAKYTANSIKCLNEKRQIIAGLVFYAGDHAGQFPYRDGLGWGMIMNPHDHHCFIINELQQSYGIPYGMWVCAVYNPDLGQRTVIVSNAVAAGISSGTWKWIAPAAVGYWVEQGGAGGGYCEYAYTYGPYVLPRGLYSLRGSDAVIADLMYCSVPGQPYGGQHLYNGKILHSNIAFADGHAEMRQASEVRLRFGPWSFGF
jgi:prepilin-type N-terminal cleavage/methylation domain-containing protein/prepilin-type processing-associated H-X9-DG protein